jgi:hypothetical protein
LCSSEGVDTGGQNVYVAHVARHLARRGYEVDIFTRKDGPGPPSVVECNGRARCTGTSMTRPNGTGAYRLTALATALDGRVGEASVGLNVLPPLRTTARRSPADATPAPAAPVLTAVAAPPAADVSRGVRPLPDAYRVDVPEDDAAYAPVALAELTADPERYDGQLVRVVGTFWRWPMGLTPECSPEGDAEASTAATPTSSGGVAGG